MRKITLLSFFLLFASIAFSQTPCSPLSPLDCSEVVVSLPVNFGFDTEISNTIQDKNSLGTGFTAVLEHSETRRPGDLAISNETLNGYEPSLLTLNAGSLEIVSQGGIAYLNPPASSNNNNQVNTLGVGMNALEEAIVIQTKLLNIVTGGSAAQAGIWFGFDEDNFVKLDVNDSNIELRVEIDGASVNGVPGQIQQNLGASGQDVLLEMIVDPSTLTVEAFYSIGLGTRTLLGSLPIPSSYFEGRVISPSAEQDNISFAGIFATHRNGAQFTASFDEFKVETQAITPNQAPVVENQTFTISEDIAVGSSVGVVTATDTDSADLLYTIIAGNIGSEFSIDAVTGEITTNLNLDFNSTEQYLFTVEVSDGELTDSADIVIDITQTSDTSAFEAHINFQDRLTVPPSGYLADYGKAFGTNVLTLGSNTYDYGWKRFSDGNAVDISDEAANNGNGAGRNRIPTTYSSATNQEKLEGTLIHFQGDNVINNTGGQPAWLGQPRGNESMWELEIPNGTYAVTLGLGDKADNNLDSRHSATVEGFTIIPAFAPNPGQTIVETMVVEVTDGILTITGLGGFNSKITHVDIVESTEAPVSGSLSFEPSTVSTTMVAGSQEVFSSNLSGSNATTIGIAISDNINTVDKNITDANDWLSLPATVSIGAIDFSINAVGLSESDTRNNTIIATAKGFEPAILTADVSIISAPLTKVTAPYRLNVAGSDYSKNEDSYLTDTNVYLNELQPTTVSATSYSPYTVPGGHQDLYFPRRYGAEFSYNFPIDNGSYTVALHMVENFQTSANARIFDVSLEGTVVIDDIDLFAAYGKGGLGLLTFDVEVLDGELNIDFVASVNNAIVQAIEILPNISNEGTDILTFAFNEQTGPALIDGETKSVTIEVTNGSPLEVLEPVITISDNATVSPASGAAVDFSLGAVTYTVTAEDGTTVQDWQVTVTEAILSNTPPTITSPATTSIVENEIDVITVTASDDNDSEVTGLQFALTGAIDDALFDIDVVSGAVTFKLAPDFEIPADTGADNVYDIQVTVTDSGALTATQEIAITVTNISEVNMILVINEIMANPTSVNDADGEWFELYNPGTEDVNIEGWRISDNDTDIHVIENGSPLLVPAGGHLILANNSNVITNGGLVVGYQYSGFTLANSNDEIVLVDTSDFEMDRVEYTDTSFPSQAGASIGFNALSDDNNVGTNWTVSTQAFGSGDLGTPGVSNDAKANESPLITSINTIEVEENQTAVLDVEVTDDLDSEGAGITYGFGGGIDDVHFAIDPDNGVLTFLTEPNFDTPEDEGADNIYDVQVTATDSGTLTNIQDIVIRVIDLVPQENTFEAHVNFSDKDRVAPAGYAVDYGKEFGFSSISSGTTSYAYGWKLLDNGLPYDVSEDALNNSTGVGRNRIGAAYDTANDQEKLEGTLVHFQGDNISSWGDGQPRKNELFWELEIPNGIYEITLGLGDKAPGNIDSRHSATVEGYTIISAFNPIDQEVRTASMVVEVTDGVLTMNGLGGYNSKITHIDVIESTDVPVNGILVFTPTVADATLVAGTTGIFSSELSGDSASDIGLTINDNVDENGSNDWLTLPITTVLGQLDFTADATLLAVGESKNSTVIATAKGFTPAILVANLNVSEGNLPCNPLSNLPCDQIATVLPLSLDFTVANGNLSESGMTMVLAPSARLASDDAIADPIISGYAPSRIEQSATGLTLTSTKGIFYSQMANQGIPNSTDTNSQMNALGVGLITPSNVFSISTTLASPDFSLSTGNSSQQAGIWFGLDEDHYVKLAVIKTGNSTGKVQLQVENMDENSPETAFLELDTNNIATGAGDISLRMEFDPISNTVQGFYTLNEGAEVLVANGVANSFQVPSSYFAGTSYTSTNPSEVLDFAGIFTTHRRADVDQPITVLFKDFTVIEEQQPLSLTFDVNTLNFSGIVGETISPQTVTVSSSSGNPTYVLSDDPDSLEWLILPNATELGDIEFGIQPDLPVGSYSTTIFASDQPDLGYANAEMRVNLEITETANDFAVNINFSDAATPAPVDYELDSGLPFGERGNGLNYGWLQTNGTTLLNLSANARNRNYPAIDIKQRTLIHMQYGDVNGTSGVLTEGIWEIDVPNGTYNVSVGVGDPDVDAEGTSPRHRINAEGVNLIDNFAPTGAAGSTTRFSSGSRIVSVSDGRLTISADAANGGFNTKINTISITATNAGVQTPRVVAVTPVDGAINVSVSPTISANDLFLPNVNADGNTGVDNSSITNSTVRLFKQGSTSQIGASVNGTGGGDAINLAPNLPLEANTTYIFEIDGVLDLVGEPFEFFTSSFTTGNGNTGPTTDLDNVSFNRSGAVASGSKYSTLTIGPDGKLYGLVISGDIHRWTINADGTLADLETLSAWKSPYGSRTSVGMVFDPAATSNNLIAYVSHNSGGLNGAPDWDGKISRLSGANLQNEELIVTDLPRSTKDHLTNSLTFKTGEPNVLYFNQGSNSAAGKPDNSWGNREESLLTAATLRLDLSLLPSTLPLNVHTTRNATAINSVDVNSPTLDGQYNPYYINAPLTLYATGIRNAYDLIWHSNGQLYVPTNGTAGGSNAPASIDGTRRPDGSFYDHSNPVLYPIIPASNGNNVQRDWLFRIDPTTDIGFYGHPNPFRGEFVLNRGDADVDNAVYDNIAADENYRGAAFDFEYNKSPNGVIEYQSDAENGNLRGALLVVRYSNSSDIIALVPDGPNGDITTFKEGIPGFGGFQDPLDLIEDVNTGNIYVSDYGRSEIVLLKPSNEAVPTARIALDLEEVTGDAITDLDTFTQEVLLSNLGNATLVDIQAQITGADANQFAIVGIPTSINAQNSVSFTVDFTPTSDGPKYAELVLSGTGADAVTIPLRGLGKIGLGGGSEPSLQWILDTQLGDGVVDVGDTNPATNLINLPNGSSYNDILGDELAIQKFERAVDAPVTLELLSVYGPTSSNPVVAFGWYGSGNSSATNELFTITNSPLSNGQTLNAPITGATEFDPGTESFGFYSRWPAFNNRQLFSEDILNTFSDAIPHHVRVYELPGEEDAYIIATEEHISGFDYQDIVVIARNIRPFNDTPLEACSPISTLDCDELEVALPFNLDFDGTEGGLSNTGFTMVDNPSARIAADGPITNPNVPGYEPSKLNISNGNLILNANNGIAFVTNGSGTNQSTEVNSQINTLGVGINAGNFQNFDISTSIVNPYTDASNNSEQAGIWFGLNEDNFVKLVANSASQIEMRSEAGGLSENVNQVIATVPNVNTSIVQLRLNVDIENNLLTAYYALNTGVEAVLGTLPLPLSFVSGNLAYDNLSFAGIFATKRRELTADVNYTFEDFAITSDNIVAFEPVKINFSLPEDVPPSGYLTDSGLGYGDRGNNYSYGWLNTAGTSTLDLSERARNRAVAGVDILQNTLVHMQFQNVDATGQEGIWEISVPNGMYNVLVGVGDANVDGQANTEPFHTINVEGVNAINRYSPSGVAGSSTRFTSGMATATVTDGRLTIDAFGGFNTKITSLEIYQGGVIDQPFFADVNPADNAVNVAINDFQITVNVVVPAGYELDKASLDGNVNLYEIVNGSEVLVPSNSNDTGGGDAITLTPLNSVKAFTSYRFRLTNGVEANRFGDLNDRIPFTPFESDFTTGDEATLTPLDLTGVEFTKIAGGSALGEGTLNQRFSSLVVGPDERLYASTIGNFASDGKIYRWDMADDGTLENLEILSPVLQGAPHPVSGARNNNDRLIIGFAFDPAATADNLIAYITHSFASESAGPEWDGVLSRLSGPDLSVVEDLIVHLPRSSKDHLTNSIIFDQQGTMYINQGSNSAGGQPDGSWALRPERLLTAAVLKLELNKLPTNLPFSAFTTDDIGVINNASSTNFTMSDGTYNPYATNAPLTLFSTGVRNAYDLVWHSNGWLYVPTNGTAGGSNSPATADYSLARRIDGLNTIPSAPATFNNETQKDWLFKTKGGSYHGHPNPYRGEFILNHGGVPYSGVPGQQEASHIDVRKYPMTLGPDPNYREPAYDFEFNKSPNGVIEYKSDAFGGKLQGLLMVVRFSGQDDLLVMQPEANGNIGNVNGDVPGLGGFDDPLDVVEDPKTGNIYVSEYDRDGNGSPKLTLLRATVPATTGPKIAAAPVELIFETTVNDDGNKTDTKTVEVTNDGKELLTISSAVITGSFANQFNAVQPAGAITINPGESQMYTVTYAPTLDNSNLGYQQASLTITSDAIDNPNLSIGLHALKKRGFEGGEEPALQDVVDALGIGINVGWTTLANGTDVNPVGDESEVELWIKASEAPINVTPVGRYSPGETLPFGWYTNENDIIETNEVAILSGGLENAQTLFPPILSGATSFNPQGAVFGFYVESNTFNRFSYTQDEVNAIQEEGVTHRTRIYPMADREGNPVENSYLIAFEDASNGDYQDYMFIIDNVIPYESGLLALDFNKDDVGFIASINQEEIPVQQITLSGNGGITSDGINLVASEEWVVIPDNFDLGVAFDLNVNTSGLSIGSYQATVIASAPNYEEALLNVSLDITNELVYTYQFNFQTPDDIETSPVGYIDDIGAGYGEQSTTLGDLSYGWVLPGTLTPAEAGVNGRNRASGTQDGVLLKTFTILGHETAATYPLRDWVVNVPNGTYSVNISVGERDFTDSNHVLDVNGTTVVNFNQENNNPENLVYFNDTKFVDVTDGVLRLSLNPQGSNAKVNYIRLAPIDNSLLPPTILANFEGNESAPDTYRGAVEITLEATDNSESGGIVRFEYVLDGNAVETYSQPISISGEGVHSLFVTAEDNNGNVSEKTFDFSIETPTGALLAIENMTKVPGTDRSFPADDYFTFHRLGSPGQALVHDSNVMRLNNTGTGDLIVTDAILSDINDYTYEVLDSNGITLSLPITIAPGSFADLDITFIGTTGNGNNGIFVEDIEIVTNADNALENIAVLHGAYSPQPEGGDEINAQEVFDAFGFQSSMLSIVNDEGTITPPNNIRFRPSSNFPLAENIDAGYEGDLILSSNFVQADPSKPVIGIQLSALHGGPGSNGARFVQVNGTNTVGGINFSHDGAYYQTLLPKTGANINFDTANTINGPFRIAISSYLSSGGNNINGNRPDLLGLRIYKVIDHKGNIVPNEYIGLQDFVQDGCGAGSANCDWNDNTFYFINIRPEGVPSAQPTDAYLANVGEALNFDIFQYFDNGYPGNTLTINASVANGSLPSWLTYNAVDGILSGTPPTDATGSIEVNFDALDGNGLTASTSLTITINEPPVAVDDEKTTTQNVAILIEDLLANDSEPNGQDISILTVDTPLNGQAELQADGISILYTPDTDYIGSDSFTYTIEDESGLTASANVTITITPENQAPEALIVTSTNEGPAALFVEFTGSGSTDENLATVRYAWNFGDGVGTSADVNTSYTFSSAGTYTVSLTVTDDAGLFDVATTSITVSAPPNTPPSAVASATQNTSNPLQFSFDGTGSNDPEGAVSYSWNFGDGNSSTQLAPSHTYALAGPYEVSFTVTDEDGLTDVATLQVVAEEPVSNGFALRINAGGPQVVHNGETFSADSNFAGGKIYVNTSATVSDLYKTERSASPPTFAYNIPLANGNYRIVLHFAEIYHGATGGGTGGTRRRVFDVTLEGRIIMNDYDINADVGPQTPVTKTFEVAISDGQMNLNFDAAGGDGVDQPKVSAIEVIGIENPVADCELPLAWTNADIGAVAADGDTCYDNGRFEVSASGADIWGSADEFHYVYQQLQGDGEIIAQVLSLDQTNVWAKAGVMMRNDLDANSASAMMIIAPNPNNIGGPAFSFQNRTTKGATMGSANFTVPALVPGGFPHYVRLVRSGSTFTGYISETNGNWTQVGVQNIAMGQTIFVGLATTSHSDGNLTNAVYENVNVITNQPQNEGPTASIVANPISGTAPLEVSFDGSGSTDDRNIVSYLWDFKDGATSTEQNPTHTFAAGIYNVSLAVFDAENESDEATVTITVQERNSAPTAIASATRNNDNPLQFNFDGSGSVDTQGSIEYLWDFGDGNFSEEVSPTYTYANEGTFNVTLTVTDEDNLTDATTLQVVAQAPVTPQFTLRINAGGPQVVENGKTFSADRNFVGGKSYTNLNAVLPPLYQTERSALPPNFGYEIPLINGRYTVTLHFAELYWGANGGSAGGVGRRIFDVFLEGNTVLNDYDIIADVGSQTVVTKTFEVVVQDGTLSLALDAAGSDGRNEPKLSAIEIVSIGTSNAAPTAVANANASRGVAPFEVQFNADGSNDDDAIVSYLWDFKDGFTSNLENPQHIFNTPGIYNVSLIVSDAEGETDEAFVSITVDEPIVNDFALRINAGGPSLTHNGKVFSADRNFVGGKSYTNNAAALPTLYQTERSALPPNFGYAVPLDNGTYQITLHFAELFWGAQGGSPGGIGRRIFDVRMEGATILDDFDIIAQAGTETVITRTFEVTITDGELNLAFDAEGSDGRNEPKLSAIEIIGSGASDTLDPIVNAGADVETELPNNGLILSGSGSDPDGGTVSYQWIQVDGPDTALLSNENTSELTAEILVEGSYVFRLSVTDDEGITAFDEVRVTAIQGNSSQIWLEAECAIVGSGWNIENDGGQSGGQFLTPPTSFQSSASNDPSSMVSFDFSATAGTYKIFGLVKTPSGTQDSFWVRVNGGPWVRWNSIPPSNNFVWHRIHLNEQLSQPRNFDFVDGINRIDIGHREGGVGLDKLYVTQTDDIPTDLGGLSNNCGSTAKSFDSETFVNTSSSLTQNMPEGYDAPVANEVSMYPNAADVSTQITMSNPEAEINKLFVYDVSGRLIRSYEGLQLKTSADAYVLQVSNLNNGIYLLRMVATDGSVFDEKLVVRH